MQKMIAFLLFSQDGDCSAAATTPGTLHNGKCPRQSSFVRDGAALQDVCKGAVTGRPRDACACRGKSS